MTQHSHTIPTCSHLINDTISPDLKIWDIDTCEHLRAWIDTHFCSSSTDNQNDALFYDMQSYCIRHAIDPDSSTFVGWWNVWDGILKELGIGVHAKQAKQYK